MSGCGRSPDVGVWTPAFSDGGSVTLGKSLSPCVNQGGERVWDRQLLASCLPVSRKSLAQVQWEGRCGVGELGGGAGEARRKGRGRGS